MMLTEFAKSVYSQNGEDGIIRRVFDVIGFESRLFIEFGFGVPECNSWRLVEEEGFGGMFIDRSGICGLMEAELAKQGRSNVAVKRLHLTTKNIGKALSVMPDEVDLLSIDVDGSDYWLWRAIKRIRARLVVIEFNKALGSEALVVRPYDPCYVWDKSLYYGASLRALARLGIDKGYKLIGCDPKGINAFFLRDDIDGFDRVDPSDEFPWKPCEDLGKLEWEAV